MMRIVALAALAIAATAALQYTSTRGLPYYYDAMIFILALTGAVLLVDTSSYSRSKRPRRIVKDGSSKHARIIYDSHQIVCQIGPWKWDIEEFCTHWFITGDTGAGKTSSGLNNLLVNKDHLKNTLDTVPDHPRAKELLPLVQHFETFYLNLKSEGQSEGELGTIGNFLAP